MARLISETTSEPTEHREAEQFANRTSIACDFARHQTFRHTLSFCISSFRSATILFILALSLTENSAFAAPTKFNPPTYSIVLGHYSERYSAKSHSVYTTGHGEKGSKRNEYTYKSNSYRSWRPLESSGGEVIESNAGSSSNIELTMVGYPSSSKACFSSYSLTPTNITTSNDWRVAHGYHEYSDSWCTDDPEGESITSYDSRYPDEPPLPDLQKGSAVMCSIKTQDHNESDDPEHDSHTVTDTETKYSAHGALLVRLNGNSDYDYKVRYRVFASNLERSSSDPENSGGAIAGGEIGVHQAERTPQDPAVFTEWWQGEGTHQVAAVTPGYRCMSFGISDLSFVDRRPHQE